MEQERIRKKLQKKQMCYELQRQMRENKNRSDQFKNDEMNYHNTNLEVQEYLFQRRQNDMDAHQKSIYDRDAAINSHYADPKQVTFTKQDYAHTERVNKLAERLNQVEN